VIGSRRSRRERDASAQSAHVAERTSAAIDRPRALTRTVHAPRLSEGVVVEASVMARLLRWRVLTLDASVLLLPASRPPTDGEMRPRRDGWRGRDARRGRLADAIKNIDHAEHELARARQHEHAAVPQQRPRTETAAPPTR
jgi:hypothetical protein